MRLNSPACDSRGCAAESDMCPQLARARRRTRSRLNASKSLCLAVHRVELPANAKAALPDADDRGDSYEVFFRPDFPREVGQSKLR